MKVCRSVGLLNMQFLNSDRVIVDQLLNGRHRWLLAMEMLIEVYRSIDLVTLLGPLFQVSLSAVYFTIITH